MGCLPKRQAAVAPSGAVAPHAVTTSSKTAKVAPAAAINANVPAAAGTSILKATVAASASKPPLETVPAGGTGSTFTASGVDQLTAVPATGPKSPAAESGRSRPLPVSASARSGLSTAIRSQQSGATSGSASGNSLRSGSRQFSRSPSTDAPASSDDEVCTPEVLYSISVGESGPKFEADAQDDHWAADGLQKDFTVSAASLYPTSHQSYATLPSFYLALQLTRAWALARTICAACSSPSFRSRQARTSSGRVRASACASLGSWLELTAVISR